LLLEKRQLSLDDRPDDCGIHPEIVMDEDISHPDDSRPGDLRVLCGEFGWECARRLADDSQVV
jgi:hypothetical protein